MMWPAFHGVKIEDERIAAAATRHRIGAMAGDEGVVAGSSDQRRAVIV